MKKTKALCFLLVFTIVSSIFLQPMGVYGTELFRENTVDSGMIGVEFNLFEGELYNKEESIAYHKQQLGQKAQADLYADTSKSFTSVKDAVQGAKDWASARNEGTLTLNISTSTSTYFPTAQEFFDLIFAYSDDCSGQEADGLKYSLRTYGYTYAGGYTGTSVSYRFSFEYRTTAQQEAELTAKVDAIMAELNIGKASEIDKIKAIYNYICDNVNYDYTYSQYTAWDALCTGTSVCQGYALAFYRLAKEADLSVRVVSGLGNGGAHAWNIVRYGNVYYNVDPTWDGQDEETRDNYFMKNMEDFVKHVRAEEFETEEFHEAFPMASTSWFDYSAYAEPLNVSNLEYYLDGIDGSTLETFASGKPKVLIFFNDACGNSIAAIQSIAKSNMGNVDIYAFEVMDATVEETQAFAQTYGGNNMKFSCSGNGRTVMWRYVYAAGLEGSVIFPVIAFIDADNKYQAISIGPTSAGEVKSYLEYYCGVVSTTLKIISQPKSVTVNEGENAVFSVGAEGSGLRYQWQYSAPDSTEWKNSNASGSNTASMTIDGLLVRDGQQYRCVITDSAGNQVTSNVATLSVKPVLAILSHPESKMVEEGETVVFKIYAKGENLSYQWQFSTDGKTWKNSGMTGATTDSISVLGTTTRDGQKYRCVVTDGNGASVISLVATLSVKTKLAVTSQPTSATVTEDAKIVFKVVAKGDGLKYQWQYSKDNGASWADSSLSGNKTASFTVTATLARDGQQYRCVISDEYGNKVTSKVVTLKVNEKLAITGQPISVTVTEGANAVFKVVAKGEGLTYQWQYKAIGTDTWKPSGATGAKTEKLTIEGTLARNGQQYRCKVTDSSGKSVLSSAATLNVKAGVKITSQPTSATVTEGTKVVFKVGATGEGLKYQWQYSKDGGATWAASSLTGNKTANFTVTATVARNGQKYRCVVTDASGNKVTSKAVTLTIQPTLSIVSNPASQTVEENAKVIFTVSAKGEGLKYQWQYSKDGGATWAASSLAGNKTANLTVTATETRNGQQYRCVITDENGNKVTSEPATLTIKEQSTVSIVTNPVSQTVEENTKVVFKVVAKGEGLKYQWQYSKDGGATWAASSLTGNKTANFTVTATAARNGQMYRCVVTDASGSAVISKAVTLTVKTELGLTIVTHPANQIVSKGATAVFAVVAEGEGLSYQWQFSKDGGATWTDSGMAGAKTASLSVEGTNSRNGQLYRCVVKDASGNQLISSAGILTVK